MSKLRPMLAATIKDIKELTFPLLASPKLDGIRCLILDGKAVTRNLKPIPNAFIRCFLEIHADQLDGLDGEIMVDGDFNSVQSAVMSEDGAPDFYYAVFDYHNDCSRPYAERLMKLSLIVTEFGNQRVREVPQITVNNEKDVEEYEQEVLADGYEGLILRNLYGTYKFGRSTMREAKLMKLKRFEDAEATIYDMEPLYENQNAPTTNALGRTERSSHQANLVAQNKLGALNVCLDNGKCFSIGTGFDDDTRKDLWARKKDLINKKVKFKFQELSADGIPRFPVYLGLRDERDL
jgi:ATP-dependent DNA ligase